MKICYYILSLLIIGIVLLAGCRRIQEPSMPSLVGAWKVTEIATVGPDVDKVNSEPQPGLFLFTQNHYSMIWTPGNNPRENSQTIWSPTAEEKIAFFNTIIVNSGIYEQTDSTFTTRPLVAKTPEFIGGSALYTYHARQDTLWLTIMNTISRDGVIDSGITLYRTSLKLVRLK